jgi:arsenate reductase-like glutaredoxin family protein
MSVKIDWYYHRNGCVTCGRSQAFLDQAGVTIAEQTIANKQKLSPTEAVQLARSVSDIWVTKGKKVIHLNLKKDDPSDADLKALLVGPSGNLRAPVIRRGKKLFVGFDAAAFAEPLLGSK